MLDDQGQTLFDDNKTEFIIIGTRQQLAKVIFATLCVLGDANKFSSQILLKSCTVPRLQTTQFCFVN